LALAQLKSNKQMKALFILGLVFSLLATETFAQDTQAQKLAELHCETGLLLDNQALADEAPFAAVTASTGRVIFKFTNQTYLDNIYITFLTDDFKIYAREAVNGTVLENCRDLVWADMLAYKVIDILPDALIPCQGIKGCNGFGFNSVLLQRAFANLCPLAQYTTKARRANHTMEMRIRFSSVGNAPVSPLARRLLALPDNATTIGDSDLVQVNLTFSDGLHAQAFPPGKFDNSVKITIGVIIGAIAFVVLSTAAYALCKSTMSKNKGNRSEMASLNREPSRAGRGGGGLGMRGRTYYEESSAESGSE
jgi:hypothetical protein